MRLKQIEALFVYHQWLLSAAHVLLPLSTLCQPFSQQKFKVSNTHALSLLTGLSGTTNVKLCKALFEFAHRLKLTN